MSRDLEPSACRSLSAYPNSPQVECIIGPSKSKFTYHAVVMATRSLYIDSLISFRSAAGLQQDDGLNAAAENNDNTDHADVTRIEFPDISVSTWEKMMKFLEPGGILKFGDRFSSSIRAFRLNDIIDVIDGYCRYQFIDGMHLCDRLLEKEYLSISEYGYRPGREVSTALRYSIQFDLPISKKIAIDLAAKLLARFDISSQSDVKYLLEAIVENRGTAMNEILHSVMFLPTKRASFLKSNPPVTTGKRKRQTKQEIQEDEKVKVDFEMFWNYYSHGQSILEEFRTRKWEEELICLRVMPVLSSKSPRGTGLYRPKLASNGNKVEHPRIDRRGALENVWCLDDDIVTSSEESEEYDSDAFSKIYGTRKVTVTVLRATKPTGTAWEIAACTFEARRFGSRLIVPTNDETKGYKKHVLYQWSGKKCHYLPPKKGWTSVNGPSCPIEIVNDDM